MHPTRTPVPATRALRAAVTLLLLTAVAAVTVDASTAAAATTWAVDGADPACSDTTGGTGSTPFCTISAAAKKALTPGDTVVVRPGTYREQVTPPASGTAAAPITYTASGPGVVVLGTRDVSDAAGWTATATTAWSRPYAPPNAPRQVFLDGSRLLAASSATATTPGSWFYDGTAKVLYVDVGGTNPGIGHAVEAGAQTYGVNVASRTGIVVDGLAVRGANLAGIRVFSSSDVTLRNVTAADAGANGVLVETGRSPVLVTGCEVSTSASHGIRLAGSTGVTVDRCRSHDNGFAGVALAGTTSSTVQRTEVWGNRVTTGTATAAGVDVNSGSTDVVVRGVVAHDNQDSGVQVYNGSHRALVVRSVSYRNGDHGFDTLGSTGVRYVNDSAHGNRNDGFSVEGVSTGATLRNSIAVDNGLDTGGYDVDVDSGSLTGTTADSDVVWNSRALPAVKWGTSIYRTLDAWATATGQEPRGSGQDPWFTDPAAGDLALHDGSPALDAADASASGFEAADAAGAAPVDDPSVPDRGSGVPTYADRGALERTAVPAGPVERAPHAVVALDRSSGAVPPGVTVLADLAGSSDTDGTGIASYTVDFGDGTVVGPQPSPTASHTYVRTGTFTVTATVTDTAGGSATATTTVTLGSRPVVTYTVDGAATGCSDTGPGTDTAPLCTITAAMGRALAGDTVLVRPATYREQVTFTRGGIDGFPLTLRGTAPGVRIVGTADVSDPAAWTATATTAWSRPYAPLSTPTQVFLDGARLAAAASVATVGPGSWAWDATAKRLYVDVGGANPGIGHTVEAGAQTYGVKAWNVADVVIAGLEVRGSNLAGISVQGGTDVTVDGVAVSLAGAYGVQMDTTTGTSRVSGSVLDHNASIGIRVNGSTGVTLDRNSAHDNAFHGISVQGSPQTTVTGNTAWGNAKPDSRVANGIDVELASTGALVEGNTTYANQDSGIQFYNGATGGTARRNLSYDNGDHGIDCFNAGQETVVGNTVVRNETAGLNFEGGCSGNSVFDNISVDNAIGSTRTIGDIRVDESAAPGTTMDRNLVHQSDGSFVYEWASVGYTSLAGMQGASGLELHSIDADARFLDEPGRDLRPAADSPAVDAAYADVPGWVSADHDGHPAVDDPSTPDTGRGTPAFGDIGALEYAGPAAALSATPPEGVTPLTVTLDASGSTALGAPLAAYRFDCGDGTVVGPQSGATATCTYATAASYTATVRVTDSSGLTDVASAPVRAVLNGAPLAQLTVSPTSDWAPMSVTADASASTDPDPAGIATYTFDCGNGTRVGPQSAATATCSYPTAGSYVLGVTVTDTAGMAGSTSATITAKADQPPTAVLRLPAGTRKAPTTVQVDASGSSDPDRTPIASYTFACGNRTTVGPQAGATAACTYKVKGRYTVTVTVRDTGGLTGSASGVVKVT